MTTKRKVLILGAAGMAGHVLKRVLESNDNYEVHTLARKPYFEGITYLLDLTDFDGLKKILDKDYEYVINAIGLLNQYAEDNPDEAILINSYLPHFLAKQGTLKGFKLIHVSTDCVFSGKKGAYKVDDTKDGIGYYAQTKAMGEVDYGNHLTFRTSIIGPELKEDGIGLFSWFMRQEGEIQGYTKAVWSGVTTLTLAYAIEKAMEVDLKGLYQLTNNQSINKFDLLTLIKDVYQKNDAEINSVEGKATDKSLINERTDFDFQVPSYREMITEMAKSMKS